MADFPDEKEIRVMLLEKRQLFMQGETTGKMFDYIQDALFVLNHRSATEPILLWIDSPGGQTLPALSIFNLLKVSQAPVHGLVTYIAASGASLVLQGCKLRCCLEHSRIHLHGVTYREMPLQMFLEEPQKFTEEGRRIQDFVFHVYEERTGKARAEIERLAKDEKPLFAPQALEFGLVDHIMKSREDFEQLLTASVEPPVPRT